jgi:hypothetical protein
MAQSSNLNLAKGVLLGGITALVLIKVAEKHYAPWVKSRQDSLTAEIEKAWKSEIAR